MSPTYVRDAAAATERLLACRIPYGLYHSVNEGAATFLEIGREIASLGGYDESLLKPVRMAQLRLKAKRPLYCAMENGKLRRTLTMPNCDCALEVWTGYRR